MVAVHRIKIYSALLSCCQEQLHTVIIVIIDPELLPTLTRKCLEVLLLFLVGILKTKTRHYDSSITPKSHWTLHYFLFAIFIPSVIAKVRQKPSFQYYAMVNSSSTHLLGIDRPGVHAWNLCSPHSNLASFQWKVHNQILTTNLWLTVWEGCNETGWDGRSTEQTLSVTILQILLFFIVRVCFSKV